MSFLKAALSVAAVAGVGYLVGTKKGRGIAGTVLKVLATPTPRTNYKSTFTMTEPVRTHTVEVNEKETRVFADKEQMGGAMSVAAHVKNNPVSVKVKVKEGKTKVDVNRTVAGQLKPLSDDAADKMFNCDRMI